MPKRQAKAAPHMLNDHPGAQAEGQSRPESASEAQRVSVLLPFPLPGCYDYLALPEQSLVPGSVVEVPLGSRTLAGVVWDGPLAEQAGEAPIAMSRLKSVLRLYPVPPMTENARRFVEWVASYYCLMPGVVLRMALSSSQALEAPRPVTIYGLSESLAGAPLAADPPASPALAGVKLTPARRRVLSELQDGPSRPLGDLAAAAGVSTSVVKGLAAKGLIEVRQVVPRLDFKAPAVDQPAKDFSPDQAAAARQLVADVERGGYSVTLLDGVTGSGKTEVYFEALAAALRQGRQVLVLLPEIALSAQWLARFADRFGVEPALWHSDVGLPRRRATWRAVAEGRAPVVVGARSALFLPYQDLGLIIVDEEQDASFKQEDGAVYHARDMAVVRGKLEAIPVILASATPSLESYANVEWGRYRQVRLAQRFGVADFPRVELVDLRKAPPPRLEGVSGGMAQSWLSPPLRAAMAETLAAGDQVLLFLNRRGYAPLTLCRRCGHRLNCPHCTAWLVEHRLARRLQCHHCGFQSGLPAACPECGAEGEMAACGPGVERLGEEVARLFPEARRAIMASDSLQGPLAAAEMVRAIQDREVDIVIGTQIAAKGHHFPHLTLVGVIDADLGLFGGDLRAGERSYQLLHQVAGRAGRAEKPGRVLLQTVEPDHPVMQAMISGDRDSFLAVEAGQREAAGLPPYGRLAAIILSGPDPRLLDDVAAQLARQAPRDEAMSVFGPAPAPLAILRGRHRRRFLIKSRRDHPPQAALRDWVGKIKIPAQIRLQIDIDPYSFL